jgi:pimeloyl-ACP methyl ester carboxylesterase
MHFAAADGTRLGVHVIGSGSPLICIPGGPGRASAYLEDLAGLSATHTLLRFDLRGTGESELPVERESLSFPRLADDVEELRIARGLETIDLLAHSAGCFVALVYAARYPQRVARLVLVTPSAHTLGDVADDIARIRAGRSNEPWYADAAMVEAERSSLPPERRERMDRGMRVFGYRRWDERSRAHADATDTQMSLRATAAFGSPVFQSEAETFLVALRAFTAPVLIVVGELDGLTGVAAGPIVAAMMPNTTVVSIPDAAHYPWVDTPEEFRTVVADFLDTPDPIL